MKRLRRPGQDDRGAVATVVAILVAGGVLLGLAAIVVDTGQIYVEREELQTGADAAALAVAKACAAQEDTCRSNATVTGLAQEYADGNASDGLSNVAEVCGRLTGVLTACDANIGNLTDCIGTVPPTGPYVQVRLSTEVSDNLALPPTFARLLAGNEGFDGASVGACARAKWEPPAAVHILGFTVSTCEFDDETGPTWPDPRSLRPRDESVLRLAPGHRDCRVRPPSPWDEVGAVTWLQSGGSCEVTMPASGIVRSDDVSGHSPPPGKCETRLRQAITTGETVYVPISDRRRSRGAEYDYHHISLAPFIVTGFYLGSPFPPGSGHAERSILTRSFPCGPFDRCISGVFVGDPISVTGVTGGGAVKLIG